MPVADGLLSHCSEKGPAPSSKGAEMYNTLFLQFASHLYPSFHHTHPPALLCSGCVQAICDL